MRISCLRMLVFGILKRRTYPCPLLFERLHQISYLRHVLCQLLVLSRSRLMRARRLFINLVCRLCLYRVPLLTHPRALFLPFLALPLLQLLRLCKLLLHLLYLRLQPLTLRRHLLIALHQHIKAALRLCHARLPSGKSGVMCICECAWSRACERANTKPTPGGRTGGRERWRSEFERPG